MVAFEHSAFSTNTDQDDLHLAAAPAVSSTLPLKVQVVVHDDHLDLFAPAGTGWLSPGQLLSPFRCVPLRAQRGVPLDSTIRYARRAFSPMPSLWRIALSVSPRRCRHLARSQFTLSSVRRSLMNGRIPTGFQARPGRRYVRCRGNLQLPSFCSENRTDLQSHQAW
jgi:hypothetical protein